jgi:hypothetical protein
MKTCDSREDSVFEPNLLSLDGGEELHLYLNAADDGAVKGLEIAS